MIGNLALESYFQPPQLSLDVSENILEQLDKNNFVGAVLIDLKKAFDTVDHKILIEKTVVLWFSKPIF